MPITLSSKSIEYAEYVSKMVGKLKSRGLRDIAKQWERMLPSAKGKNPATRKVTFGGDGLWAQWSTPRGAQVTVGGLGTPQEGLFKTVDFGQTTSRTNSIGLNRISHNFATNEYSYTCDGVKTLNESYQEAHKEFRFLAETEKRIRGNVSAKQSMMQVPQSEMGPVVYTKEQELIRAAEEASKAYENVYDAAETNVGLLLATLRQFDSQGQHLILSRMKQYRDFFKAQGKTMSSFRLWDSPDSICIGTPTALNDSLKVKLGHEITDTRGPMVYVKTLLNRLVQKVKTTSVPKGKNTALNINTGVQERISIDEFKKFDLFREAAEPIEICARDAAGKVIGKMVVGHHPTNGTLVIHQIAASDEYSGVGREMIRRVVEQSERLGLGGRVSLTAWTGYLPDDYLQIAGKKSVDAAAAIKYHRMGFRAVEPKLEQEIVETINNGGTGLSQDGVRDYLVGHMELSEEGIRQFLA